jgi:serine phosphatase RsbU (regulator of sigma subunit)
VTAHLARDIIVTTAVATVYAVAGLLALLAAHRWRGGRGRIPALLLGWAMLQHAVNQMSGSVPIQSAIGGPAPLTLWAGLVTAYFIAVPWAMLLERVIGPGWRSSIRRTWQVFAASAMGGVLFDVLSGRPGAAAGVNGAVIGAGAFVGFANLFVAKGGMPAQVLLLRAGLLTFLALVIHDALAGAGLLPWRATTGPFGVLIAVATIGYTALSRALRGQRELRAMEHEMATARRIQSLLLPAAAPVLDGATLVFRYVPAAAVAGDIFDFLGGGPRRVGILVADVSGHGVSAALIASMVKVAAAAQKAHADDPARVLAGIHLALADELPRAHFVTACYAYVDLDRGVMRHASAGHPPPLVWRAADRAFAPEAETGPLIIAFAPPVYPVTEVRLAPGDRVLMYTDGITEAMRGDEEMFGVERLREVVSASRDGAERLASDAIDAAAAFRGRHAAGFEDDCTLVVLEMR